MNTSLQIYLARNNVQAGPYTLQQFNQMVESKQVQESDLIWHYGMNAWSTVGEQTAQQLPYAPNVTLPEIEAPSINTNNNAKTQEQNQQYTQIDRRRKPIQMVVSNLAVRAKAKAIDLSLWLPISIIPTFFSTPELAKKINALGGDLKTLAENQQQILALIPTNAFIVMAIYLIAMLVIQALMIKKYGQSIGKRLMKIRIIDLKTGAQASFNQGFVMRSLLFIVLGQLLPFLYILDAAYLLFGDRRTLHDRLAKTIVVNAEDNQLKINRPELSL